MHISEKGRILDQERYHLPWKCSILYDCFHSRKNGRNALKTLEHSAYHPDLIMLLSYICTTRKDHRGSWIWRRYNRRGSYARLAWQPTTFILWQSNKNITYAMGKCVLKRRDCVERKYCITNFIYFNKFKKINSGIYLIDLCVLLKFKECNH